MAPNTTSGPPESPPMLFLFPPSLSLLLPSLLLPRCLPQEHPVSIAPLAWECAVPITPLQDAVVPSLPFSAASKSTRARPLSPPPLASSPPPAPKKQHLAAAMRVSPFKCLAPMRELPHEHLARQQDAAACLAALTLLPWSPTLLQEVRDKALVSALPLEPHRCRW
jgi:hypothetical protein